jgi:hypothetical protein
MRVISSWVFLAAALWAGSSAANTLVLVSIDGFGGIISIGLKLTKMKTIAQQGTRVTKLRTVYPSKTFPGTFPSQRGYIRPAMGWWTITFVAVTAPIATAWAAAARTLLVGRHAALDLG